MTTQSRIDAINAEIALILCQVAEMGGDLCHEADSWAVDCAYSTLAQLRKELATLNAE